MPHEFMNDTAQSKNQESLSLEKNLIFIEKVKFR